MRTMWRRLDRSRTRWSGVLLALILPAAAVAQRLPTDRTGNRAVEVWAGISRGSSMWGQLGDMPHQTITLTGIRFVERVRRTQSVSVEYGVDVIPVAVMSPPYQILDESCGATCGAQANPASGAQAHGAGINPVSLTAIFRADRALQLRAGGSAGALWFDRPVPITTAAQFNFTAAIELGAQVIGRHGNGLIAQYRFHHLSNGGLGAENPGIASHVLSLGARWRVGRTIE